MGERKPEPGSFADKVQSLDAALTGKRWEDCAQSWRNQPQLHNPGGWLGRFYYLSDGGYSRLYWSDLELKIKLTNDSQYKVRALYASCDHLVEAVTEAVFEAHMSELEESYKDEDESGLIRAWVGGPFFLTIRDTGRRDERGCTIMAYSLYDGGHLIFDDNDFCGSPGEADDSDRTLSALLGFLSLQPGDTDKEYFDKYNALQLEWANQRAEELSIYQLEIEEGLQNARKKDE